MRKNEAEYIESRCDKAAGEVAASLERLRRDSVRTLDIEAWGRQAPWCSVGAAFLAGFGVGRLIKMSARAVTEQPRTARPSSAAPSQGAVRREPLLYPLLRPLLSAMGAAITTLIGLRRPEGAWAASRQTPEDQTPEPAPELIH